MTFEDALEFKSKIEPSFIHKGLPMKPFVTPSLGSDMTVYFNDFRVQKMTDEHAKLYCSNGEFTVKGICFIRDINYLYHFDFPR